ncbi:AraC family transcriptional regulator [Shimia sp. NS0008-38b]|uniref:helix-turn-helix transcriptional regulator n=1 Tax=Shimia sp. NS0008-38b TaxID=3127653 RepID=UPI00310B5F77
MHAPFTSSEIVFASEPEGVTLWPYRVSVAGRTIAHAEEGVVRRNYHQHVWIYTLEGEGAVDVAGTRHLVHPGAVTWIDTAQVYAHGAGVGTPWRYLWMSVSGFELDAHYAQFGLSGDPSALVPEQVGACFETVVEALLADGGNSVAQINAAVSQVLAAFAAVRGHAVPLAQDAHISGLVSALRKDITRTWTIADMVDLTGVCQSHMFRRFKAHTGVSPIVWLRRERITLGAFLLRSTNERIGQIAARSGYADPFHFSRDFKLENGCAPRVYRAQFRNGS